MAFDKFDEVKELVQLYIQGSHGDVKKLKEVYHPRAMIMGHGEKLGFKGHFPAEKLLQIMEEDPRLAGPEHKMMIRSMDITKDVGMVVLDEKDFHGVDFVDYLSVAKIEGKWWVTNKTYTSVGKEAEASKQ